MADALQTRSNGQRRTYSPFVELGSTGLAHYHGYLAEEHLRAWQQHRKARTIRDMQTDAIISASLLVYNMLIRQVTWDFQANSDDLLAQEHAEFAKQVWFEDMSYPWREVVAEILTMLPWGWNFEEITFKRRLGDNRDPSRHSQFTDGRIGIRKLATRAQETLERWEFDDEGGIQGMWQMNPTAGQSRVLIPIEKALLFRTSLHKGSPEGQSILRGAYISFFQKRQIAQLQAIGIERDAAGLPVVRIPGTIITDPAHAATYEAYKTMAVNLRQDEQGGIVLPSDRDEHGQYHYDVSLLSTAGAKQFDTVRVIQQLNMETLLALLTDVLVIGHEKAGSWALSSDKTALLSTALGGIMDIITEVVNRHGMPRLWRLNGFPPETQPRMVHGDVESIDLNEVSNYILRLAQAGFQVDDLQDEVRRRTGFPPMPVEEEL